MANEALKEILDMISVQEGTTTRPDGNPSRGYNETLDYGKWTGGDVDLTEMTVREVIKLQGEMLAQPGNDYGGGKGSSAVGRYQIVRKTLRSLVRQGHASLDDLYDAETQDRLAAALLKGRGYNQWVAGKISTNTFVKRLGPEWASLGLSSGKTAARTTLSGLKGVATALDDDWTPIVSRPDQIASPSGSLAWRRLTAPETYPPPPLPRPRPSATPVAAGWGNPYTAKLPNLSGQGVTSVASWLKPAPAPTYPKKGPVLKELVDLPGMIRTGQTTAPNWIKGNSSWGSVTVPARSTSGLSAPGSGLTQAQRLAISGSGAPTPAGSDARLFARSKVTTTSSSAPVPAGVDERLKARDPYRSGQSSSETSSSNWIGSSINSATSFYDAIVRAQRTISNSLPASTSTVVPAGRASWSAPGGVAATPEKATWGSGVPSTIKKTVTRTIEVDNPEYTVWLGQLQNNQRMTPTGAVVTADQFRALNDPKYKPPKAPPALGPAPPKKIQRTVTEVIETANPDYVRPKKVSTPDGRSSWVNPSQPATFKGSATGKDYTVGGTYVSADGQRILKATSDGKFETVGRTGTNTINSPSNHQAWQSTRDWATGSSGSGSSGSGANGGTTRSMESSSRWQTGY
jgi:muramidase (phage lysozyme)